jgi:hypothetical protein
MCSAWEPSDVRNDGDDLTFQTVQELFQFALVGGHAQVKAMDAIFCGHVKFLSFVTLHSISSPDLLKISRTTRNTPTPSSHKPMNLSSPKINPALIIFASDMPFFSVEIIIKFITHW